MADSLENATVISHSAPPATRINKSSGAAQPRVVTSVLPSLRSNNAPRIDSTRMPRRYEDTRPAHLQDFNHNRILGVALLHASCSYNFLA